MTPLDASKEPFDQIVRFPRLAKIKSPADLKAMDIAELSEVAEDVPRAMAATWHPHWAQWK